jgi:charged multivesicular body protein 1
MQQVNKAMGQTVKGMSSAMKSMNVDDITKTMESFEKQFEDMDVKSAYMEGAMEASTSLSTPPEEVELLIRKVADEHGLTVSTQMDTIGSVSTSLPAGKIYLLF